MKQNGTWRVSEGLAPACHRLPVESMNACTCVRREQEESQHQHCRLWGVQWQRPSTTATRCAVQYYRWGGDRARSGHDAVKAAALNFGVNSTVCAEP